MASGFKVNGTDLTDLYTKKEFFFEGNLLVWGYNGYGQLGDNIPINTNSATYSPVQTIAGGTNWKQVACGTYHTAAIKTTGELWTWGRDYYGQIGDNTVANKSSPVQTIAGGTNWKQVACGYAHIAAIKTDGTLWLWGCNYYGGLGDNTVTHKSSPVQVYGGGTNWKQVACGTYHTAAIKTTGELWTWGCNSSGGLGDNTSAHKSSPVQTIAGGTNWKQVACGQFHTAAIKTTGELWTWGYNYYGQLGDNTVANKYSPVQVYGGGTNWKQVACGQFHTAAIKTTGELWTWGRDGYGELGDNTSAHKSSPVQTIAGGTNWKQVACGGDHTAAIKTNGELWLWGRNVFGQLGDYTIANKSSPVQVYGGGTNWKQVSCGSLHTAVITENTL